jgi:hypothetical protein
MTAEKEMDFAAEGAGTKQEDFTAEGTVNAEEIRQRMRRAEIRFFPLFFSAPSAPSAVKSTFFPL